MGESSTGPTGSLSAVLETAMPGDWDVMGVADCRSAAAIRVLMIGSDGDSPLGSGGVTYNFLQKSLGVQHFHSPISSGEPSFHLQALTHSITPLARGAIHHAAPLHFHLAHHLHTADTWCSKIYSTACHCHVPYSAKTYYQHPWARTKRCPSACTPDVP